MDRRSFLVAGAALSFGGCAATATGAAPTPLDANEQAQTISALRPPKRTRPVVAVLGSPDGAETTDLIVPYGVLRQSGLAEVRVVSPTTAAMPLMPALNIRPQMDLAAFDAHWPDGADYVIVPALHRDDDPTILSWIMAQSRKGALICGICAGALVLSNAGLIDGRRATTHWYRIDELQRSNPNMRWVRDRRYVVDGGVATTTGISASVPLSLTLVEAIGGADAASALARQLGVASWSAEHDSAAFRLSGSAVWTALRNRAAFWRQEQIGIPIADGVDEVTLALVSDVYSETYRSSAFAIGQGIAQITTSQGLELLPSSSSGMDRVIAPLTGALPMHALNAALRDITARYGRATAEFAALNLEYPWRG
ncbi:MAG: DJ-1/PfpI family protein [Terricaulis sp.]